MRFIAAGVLPSILDAEPIVVGCDLFSFSIASFDRPAIFE